jgi:GT2 family glycosyltransferase
MAEPGLVSVLIVTYNRRDDAERAIRSALSQTYQPVEVVVLDNGSTDDTASLPALADGRVRYVRVDANLGCPSGRNAGIAHCAGEFVYQLDDDGWLPPDAVETAMARMARSPSIGVVESRLVLVPQGQDEAAIGTPETDVALYRSTFSGGRALIRAALFESVGLYPEHFWRQGEEQDLALRAMAGGWLCVSEPRSVMFHRPSPVGRDDYLFTYYALRNWSRTALRLWPFPQCWMRVALGLGRALRASVRFRRPGFLLGLTADLLLFLFRLPRERRPVGRAVFRAYRRLWRSPSPEPPELGEVDGHPRRR